jgi:hypothetical protein
VAALSPSSSAAAADGSIANGPLAASLSSSSSISSSCSMMRSIFSRGTPELPNC